MPHSRRFLKAAKTLGSLFTQCLNLSRGLRLCILAQQDCNVITDACVWAANNLEIAVQVEYFTREELLGSGESLAEQCTQKCKGYSGALLVSEWSPETTAGRLEVVRRIADEPNCPGVGSIPGARIDILAKCQFNLSQIVRDCCSTYSILAPAQWVFLITEAPTKSQSRAVLSVPRDPNFFPIISTGIISPGMWGNCPSGETFFLPLPYGASGTVYIDGSLPRRSLQYGEWCHLRFEKGRILYPIAASSSKLTDYVNNLFFGSQGRVRYKNSNTLAELGVGTNAGIAFLTGNPIFDEKKLGTVHLGIGSNTQFGGSMKSQIHHDIVCVHPKLVVDRTVILADGKFKLTPRMAYRPLSSFPLLDNPQARLRLGKILIQKDIVALNTEYMIDPRRIGHWFTTHATTRGPKVHTQIVEEKDTGIVEQILSVVTSCQEQDITLSSIVDAVSSGAGKQKIRTLVGGMVAYQILEMV